ncbi:cobalamin biosynthesis protein CobG [Streptomyces sp. H27-D2]|uniref:cobalamin biosynthesis protein CobG n=1 Tax=Streptomyces sp. H27-D2 TaxID=3046304 RepID=UPI002DB74815|nr:cobalamin biosynthesis protein CobG [Streptomyces sp. H27-D2]MEC4016292.1 cobalamin biosynthesis protein CobG [Streptomyces sp. H27-D2]
MPPAPSPVPTGDASHIRDRGDACPGALRLHTADDGALARVRIPAGALTARQADALADAAERLGDGNLDLTSRGNVQLRGLAADCGAELARALHDAGLLPAPRHERVRNIVASPLSGLDGSRPDVQPWARSLDELLCASESATELSGRFLFACDDGRGDVAALGADVTVLAERSGRQALVRIGAGPAAVRVAAADAARAALLAAEVFLAVAREGWREGGGTRAWRVRDLGVGVAGAGGGSGAGGAGVSAEAVSGASPEPGAGLAAGQAPGLPGASDPGLPAGAASGLPAEPAPGPPVGQDALSAPGFARWLTAHGIDARYEPEPPAALRPGAERGLAPTPGLIPAPDGRAALSVLAPLGRLTSAQWRKLAAIAAEYGSGGLRVTPWRGVVLPGVPAGAAPRLLAELDDAGLVTTPGSPWLGVGACTGRPGCAKSLSDVRADASAARDAGSGGLPVHWSGCERRCGHPQGTSWVDVVATPDGYDISAHGAPVRRGVQPTELADALAAARITPAQQSTPAQQ